MSTDYSYHILDDAAHYVTRASSFIEAALKSALDSRGRASLLVSGGSSPKPVYEQLSESNLDWANVTVSLVDERWVPEGADGSNATFIKNTLLQNKAKNARFVPMVNEAKTAAIGAPAMSEVFDAAFPDPIDVCVMGMGTDGHTASWFPRSPTLSTALDIDVQASLIWQDATGQAGGSGFNDRITVSLPVVMNSRSTCLLIPGAAKKLVWDESADKDVYEAPVTTLRAAGPRLHVFTHEGG
jgi:6-phosphogluconolactonase